MQSFVNQTGQLAADTSHFDQIVYAGLRYALQAAKLFQQFLAFFRSQTRDRLQNRTVATAGALHPVPADSEPVRLITDTLDQMQSPRV